MSPIFSCLSVITCKVLRNCLITPRPFTKYGPYAGRMNRDSQAPSRGFCTRNFDAYVPIIEHSPKKLSPILKKIRKILVQKPAFSKKGAGFTLYEEVAFSRIARKIRPSHQRLSSQCDGSLKP